MPSRIKRFPPFRPDQFVVSAKCVLSLKLLFTRQKLVKENYEKKRKRNCYLISSIAGSESHQVSSLGVR